MGNKRNKLYDQWHGMCRRCHDPRRKDYKKYGGRGISVCAQWRGSNEKDEFNNDGYLQFEKWARAHGYKEGMELDRINNKHGYRPENCRWISRRNNCYNRVTNHHIVIDGVSKTMTEWCEIYGITSDVVCHRLDRGWTEKEAITIKKGGRRK